MAEPRKRTNKNTEKVILELNTEAGILVKEFPAGTIRDTDTVKQLLHRFYLNRLKSANYQTVNRKQVAYKTSHVKDLETDSDGNKRLVVTFSKADEYCSLPSIHRIQTQPTQETHRNPLAQTFRQAILFANHYGVYKIPIIIPFLLACIWIIVYHPQENNKICFDHTGCYTLDHPWNQRPPVFHFVPQSPLVINVTFHAVSRQYPSRIPFEDFTVKTQKWSNEVRDVILIVHGYMDDSSTWIQTLTQALLSIRDAIIIQVDWKRGARMYYPQVVANTRVVGKEIYRLIHAVSINEDYAIDIIGHSLGAHIASYAAKIDPKLIRRIIALDPAFPLFEGYHEDIRLDLRDAEQVLVIHSNIGPFGCGMRNPVGTVDLYLNNGQDQPGCTPMNNLLSQPLTVDGFSSMQDKAACSHRRAYEVFEEFIKSRESFVIYECPSVNHLLREHGEGCEATGLRESHLLLDLFENVSARKGEGHIYWMPTSDSRPFFIPKN